MILQVQHELFHRFTKVLRLKTNSKIVDELRSLFTNVQKTYE